MSRITPRDNKKIFTEDVLKVLPTDKNIKVGVSNRIKGDDPEYQEKIKQIMKETWQTDQSHRTKSISKTITKKWQDPEHIEKQKIGRAERYATPERCGNFKSLIRGTCKKTGKQQTFAGAQQLRDAGFEPGNVYSCLNGDRKSAGGYTWERL